MAGFNYGSHSSGIAERRLQITEFLGMDQSRGIRNPNPATSPDAVNFIARRGVLRTAGGIQDYATDIPLNSAWYTSESRPRLHQAFFRTESGDDFWKLMATFNRSVWAYNFETNTWTEVGQILMDGCDMVNYRYQTTEWAIFMDGSGQMYYWDGAEATFTAFTPTQGVDGGGNPAPLKFQQIALLYERLWGAVYKDAPDRLYWSDSFSPTNWEPNYSNIEDGGGFVDVATFDGSRIRAIVPAFGDMLIFKDRSIHRINGTYPGEFQVTQVYGTSGTLAPRSIVNAGQYVFFLSSEGLCRYDGSEARTLKSFGDRKLADVWASMNHAAIDEACAVFYDGVVYLSVCLDPNESRNTHVIEYDTVEMTYSVVELPGVDDFLVLRDGQEETLLAISWNKVYRYDAGATFDGQPIEAVWTSPEFTASSVTSKKVSGYFYMTVEAASLDVDRSPSMKISVIGDNRTRDRVIQLKPGIQVIKKRVRGKGRALRFRVSNMNGDPLVIHRGMEILLEEDID